MTTVLCHGVFDIVHPGHLEHFRQAKALGDRLVVAIVADAHVRKGADRPMFNQKRRAAFLSGLKIVDEVIIVDSPVAGPVLETLRPEVYCKGSDYRDDNHQFAKDFQKERAFVESYGGRVVLTDGFTGSSTAIINRMKRPYPELESIRWNYGIDGVLSWMEKAKQGNATVIGEEITDEYIYVRPLFKTPKDNIISFESVGRNTWEGGAAIIERDLQEFAGQVSRVKNRRTVRKLRYVDEAFKQKLFSIVERKAFIGSPDVMLGSGAPDLLVVADYGHGMINEEMAKEIVGWRIKCLALMVQSNSANWGFNLLTKWPRADYVVADRNELQLAMANQTDDIASQAIYMAAKMKTRYLAVTLGHEGCLVVQQDHVVKLPALTDRVVDRMGAGDAFLAATAPLVWAGAPAEIIALVGNVAGAIKVGKLGNQTITRQEVEALLKELLA